MAEPGEFTLRAFMNGRIDLTQAEGVRDSVLASTDAQMRQANLLREGALRDQVREIRESVISALAAIEASTDFSEEIGDVDKVAMIERCLAQKRRIDALLETERASRIQREGAVVAIVGRPNAGKSSLLNALLQSDRAIVTDVPGTTRDTIEESFAVGGMLLRLIDTAGLRDSADAVESFGIERSLAAISNADAVIYVYDAACGWSPQDQGLYDSIMRPKIIVANKIDLNRHPEIGIGVSAIQGTGLACLLEEMLSLLAEDEIAPPPINARHAGGLREASEALGRACEALLAPVPTDLVAVDLGVAIRALGEITGETAGVDVIERVFHDFCIGK
jgi:tRNA modification GTPase